MKAAENTPKVRLLRIGGIKNEKPADVNRQWIL
jgi:hypothetical protein